MKHTKESIAQYCVDSKGDKDLAEQIARQFERAGFKRAKACDFSYDWVCVSSSYCNAHGQILDGDRSCDHVRRQTPTTLSELTKMVDSMLGEPEKDEYEIVREFMDMRGEFRHYTPKRKENAIERFKTFRVCNPTLDELKAVYAESKGIEVEKIEVKEETKC